MLSSYFQEKKRQQHHWQNVAAETATPPLYEPVNDKARQFHASTAKVRMLPGGNRSGKTTTASKEGVDIMRAAPKNMQGTALTDTYDNIGKNLWPCYRKWLMPHEWKWIKGNRTEENPKIIKLIKSVS